MIEWIILGILATYTAFMVFALKFVLGYFIKLTNRKEVE